MTDAARAVLEQQVRDSHLIIAALAAREDGRLVLSRRELSGSPRSIQVYQGADGGMVITAG